MVCPQCQFVTVSEGHKFCPKDATVLVPDPVHRVGDVGVRDTQFPCEMFDYGQPDRLNTCESDGHYMCQECKHLKLKDEDEEAGE